MNTQYPSTAPAPSRQPPVAQRSATVGTQNSGTIKSSLNNVPSMKQIIIEFVGGLEESAKQMEDLLGRNEMKPLSRVIHQLRGCAGGYGFDQVSELAAQAETSIRASASIEVIAAQTNALVDVVRRIEGFGQKAAVAAAK